MLKGITSPGLLACVGGGLIAIAARLQLVVGTPYVCGTVLGLIVALTAHRIVYFHFDSGLWNQNLERTLSVAAGLHLALYSVLMLIVLFAMRRSTEARRRTAVGIVTASYLVALYLFPPASECP